MLSKNKKRLKDTVYTAMFAALIAVCSLIYIPLAVPITMQTFAVFLALFLLGGKHGTLAVLVYIAVGLAGMPVFSGFIGGFGVLFGATGGYIIGFALLGAVYAAGEKIFGSGLAASVLCAAAGLAVCYLFGSVWFAAVYSRGSGGVGFAAALSQCVLPFIIPDAVKMLLAVFVKKKLAAYIKIN
jgi:biotin transport system substrate-specific component